MKTWLVPITLVPWIGKPKKKTFRVRGKLNEWQAQNLALIKFKYRKRKYGWMRRYDVHIWQIDHAIDMETMKCNHGCCSLGKR